MVLVLYPDHTLSQEEGCGDFLGCAVNSEEGNSMPCKLASEIEYAIIDCSTIDTANLRNQECAQ